MTDRELDALVALHVFGYRWYESPSGNCRWLGNPSSTADEAPHWPMTEATMNLPLCRDAYRYVPYHTTNPGDDYVVLNRVRNSWNALQIDDFIQCLDNILSERDYIEPDNSLYGMVAYLPGDYARAALMALEIPID